MAEEPAAWAESDPEAIRSGADRVRLSATQLERAHALVAKGHGLAGEGPA